MIRLMRIFKTIRDVKSGCVECSGLQKTNSFGPFLLLQNTPCIIIATKPSTGDLYVSDSTIVAGNGLRGYNGDGMLATPSRLSSPRDGAIDPFTILDTVVTEGQLPYPIR